MATQDVRTSLKVNTSTTASDIKQWVKNVPDKARMTIEVTQGDRPFDPGEQRLTARWTQEVEED